MKISGDVDGPRNRWIIFCNLLDSRGILTCDLPKVKGQDQRKGFDNKATYPCIWFDVHYGCIFSSFPLNIIADVMIKGLLHQKQRPLFCNESMTHEALYFCSCHSEGFHVNTGTFIFLPPFALQIVHPLSKLNCNPAGTFLKAVCSFCWSV